MKKKTYIIPKAEAVVLLGPSLMTSGSHDVKSYTTGADINIGDSDDETPTNGFGNASE